MANQTRRTFLRGMLTVPAATALASGSAQAESLHNGINMQAYNALRLVNTAELWFRQKWGKYGPEDELNRSPILPRCIYALEKSSEVAFPPCLSNLADAAKGLDFRLQTTRGDEGYIAWTKNTHTKNGNLYLATDERGGIYRGRLTDNVNYLGGRQFRSLEDLFHDLTPAFQPKSRGSISEMLSQFAYSVMAVQSANSIPCCTGICTCFNGESACCTAYNTGSCSNTGCPDTPWCCCCYLARPQGILGSRAHELS